MDLVANSLYALLETNFGLLPNRAHQSFEATLADPYEQDLFSLPSATAMILVKGITYSDKDHQIEYFKAVYRGDRCSFGFESHRHGKISPVTLVSVKVS